MSKAAKEAFVSGLEGTSPLEIVLVVSCIPIGVACFHNLPLRSTIFAEVLALWIPILLCQSNLLYSAGLPLVALQLIYCLFICQSRASLSGEDTDDKADLNKLMRKSMTVYRSSLLYLTFVAILAVDFHVFPRKFAKTETKGYGLMDLGAASFCIAAGFVSSRARSKPTQLRRDLSRTLPLVLLGVLRLVTHKGIEYQEHVSEYGVHWNFSFTLAVLSPIGLLLPGPTWQVPLAALLVYQYFLSTGLQQWIEEAPRVCMSEEAGFFCHLFAANREGVLGCIGYGSLYLVSEWIGKQYLWNQDNQTKSCRWLFFLSFVFGAMWYILTSRLDVHVSRRSTNLAFCTWVMFINTGILSSIHLVYVKQRGSVPRVLGLVNKQGLSCFVFANLMTGLVNISINTMEQSDQVAFLVLIVYLALIASFAFLLDMFISKIGAGSKGKQT